jgi:uncharacterized membrane protein (DUF106 family)
MDYIAFSEVLVISFTAALASKLVTLKMLDMTKINKMKKDMNEKRKELKKMKPGTSAYTKLSEEVININLELSKMQLKPSIITIIPFLLLFLWMSTTFKNTPAFFILPFELPVIGNDIGWLLTYFIATMIFSAILTKIIDKMQGRDKNV